ncbi:hypothetical protein OIV83_002324 [Microbotryomycetes sp. JL201]|nr:hypothetical protein OIV83_002324 [Microbotryomycetes sp. JL201]
MGDAPLAARLVAFAFTFVRARATLKCSVEMPSGNKSSFEVIFYGLLVSAAKHVPGTRISSEDEKNVTGLIHEALDELEPREHGRRQLSRSLEELAPWRVADRYRPNVAVRSVHAAVAELISRSEQTVENITMWMEAVVKSLPINSNQAMRSRDREACTRFDVAMRQWTKLNVRKGADYLFKERKSRRQSGQPEPSLFNERRATAEARRTMERIDIIWDKFWSLFESHLSNDMLVEYERRLDANLAGPAVIAESLQHDMTPKRRIERLPVAVFK